MVNKDAIKTLITATIHSGKTYAKGHGSASPLMYAYYDTEYLGMYHFLLSSCFVNTLNPQIVIICPLLIVLHCVCLSDIAVDPIHVMSQEVLTVLFRRCCNISYTGDVTSNLVPDMSQVAYCLLCTCGPWPVACPTYDVPSL